MSVLISYRQTEIVFSPDITNSPFKSYKKIIQPNCSIRWASPKKPTVILALFILPKQFRALSTMHHRVFMQFQSLFTVLHIGIGIFIACFFLAGDVGLGIGFVSCGCYFLCQSWFYSILTSDLKTSDIFKVGRIRPLNFVPSVFACKIPRAVPTVITAKCVIKPEGSINTFESGS